MPGQGLDSGPLRGVGHSYEHDGGPALRSPRSGRPRRPRRARVQPPPRPPPRPGSRHGSR
jgi:hypothetical protein